MTYTETLAHHVELATDKYPTVMPFYCALYGSQNYEMSTPESDVDSKMMVVPSFKDVVLGRKQLSTDMADELGALCNVKDVRAMMANYMKGNVNFVETLYTPYYVYNPDFEFFVNDLRKHRDLFGSRDPYGLMRMAAGMARQKYVAFEKPFESKQEVLAKYGYDPKQLHHLCRLLQFMNDYMQSDENFGASLVPSRTQREYLMELKTEPMPYAEARALCNYTMTEVDEMLEMALQHYDTPAWRAEVKKRTAEAQKYMEDFVYGVVTHLPRKAMQQG